MTPVIIVGMVAGSALVVTAIVIFIAKKEFSTGGVGVLLIALVLIGMSQWSNIEIEGGGIKIKALRDAIRETAAAADEVAAQAEQAAAGVAATKEQLASLTQQIENSHVLSPNLTKPIQARLSAAPIVDRAKLAMARANLRRLTSTKP